MTNERLLEAARAALKIEHNPPPTIAEVLLVARGFLHLYGGNSTVEQLARAEEWARGADERVSDASEALDAAGIGHVRKIKSGNLPQVTISDRVRVIAARLSSLTAELSELRVAAKALSTASTHCRFCRDCGDGPCCNECGAEAAGRAVDDLVNRGD